MVLFDQNKIKNCLRLCLKVKRKIGILGSNKTEEITFIYYISEVMEKSQIEL